MAYSSARGTCSKNYSRRDAIAVTACQWGVELLHQHAIDATRSSILATRESCRDRIVQHRSWLSRAIETAWLALQELDALWVPIIKSWRLNERMYGALTGLSKKAILGEHGADSA